MKLLAKEQALNAWGEHKGSHADSVYHVYNLGVEHGRQHATEERPLWPEPITDRPPTEADADPDGLVQFRYVSGRWDADKWDIVARDSNPWQHTPKWQPKPPTLNQLALADLEAVSTAYPCLPWDIIRRALEAQP